MESDNLFSLEIFIESIQNLSIECGIPAVAFRFLDYPTLLVYYAELDVIDNINKKLDTDCIQPDDVLKDLDEFRTNDNGYDFHKGKSCLFRQTWDYLKRSLAEIPLYVTLVDCIRKAGGGGGVSREKPRILGVASLPLLPLVGTVEGARTGPQGDSPVTAHKMFVVKLFNLMGTQIGVLNVSVKLTCYGTSLLRHVTVEDNKDSHINIFLKNLSLNEEKKPQKTTTSVGREKYLPIRELIQPDGKIDVTDGEETAKNCTKSSQTKRGRKTTKTRIRKHVRETMYTEEQEFHTEHDSEEHDNMFRPPPLFLNLHPSQRHTITKNISNNRRASECNKDDTIQRSRFLTETKFQEFTDEDSWSTSSNEDNEPIIERLFRATEGSVYTTSKTNSYYGNNKNNEYDLTVEGHRNNIKSNLKKINSNKDRGKEESHDSVSLDKLKKTMPTLCSLVAEIAKFNDILNGSGIGNHDDSKHKRRNISDGDHVNNVRKKGDMVEDEQKEDAIGTKGLISKDGNILMESPCVRFIENQTKDVKSQRKLNKVIGKQSDNKKQQKDQQYNNKKKIEKRREGRYGGNKTKLSYGLTRTQRLRYAITHGGMNLSSNQREGVVNGGDEEGVTSQIIRNFSRDFEDGPDLACDQQYSIKGKIFIIQLPLSSFYNSIIRYWHR